MSSLEDNYCRLYYVRQIKTQTFETDTIDVSDQIINRALSPSEEDGYCPVCLEPLNKSNPCSFSTACNHTFHIACIAKLEGSSCPVCRYPSFCSVTEFLRLFFYRFQHDSSLKNLTECFVCGYVGGLNDSNESASINHIWNPVGNK